MSLLRPTASRLWQIRTLTSVSAFLSSSFQKPAAHRSPFRHCRPVDFQMPLAVFTAADKRNRVQGHPATAAAAISGLVTASIQNASRRSSGYVGARSQDPFRHQSERPASAGQRPPVRHQGGKMRLKLVRFRRRPAMRRPTNASLNRVTPSTAKTGKTLPSSGPRAKIQRPRWFR